MSKRRILKLVLAIGLFVAVVSVLSYLDPHKIVGSVGINNIYLVVFLLAIVGGVSSTSAAGYYATLFSFVLGGANPFILALISAPGVLIGDYIFWYIGRKSKRVVEEEYGHIVDGFMTWLDSKPKWFIPIAVYAYTGLTPFPGDLLMFVLAFIGQKFSQIFIPILLGNYTLALIVGATAAYGYRALP